jgi:hypothetical protein
MPWVGPTTTFEDMLVDPAELAQWVGWTNPSDGDTARASDAIRFATGIIQDACSPMAQPRRLIRVNSEQIILDGNGAETFRLPDWPVIGIDSITEEGTLVDPTAYDWSADHGIVRRTDTPGVWTKAWQGLVIVYSHGYDPVPAALIGVCRSIAARLLAEPDGREVRLEALGAYSVGYQGKGVVGLTSLEAAALARYGSAR